MGIEEKHRQMKEMERKMDEMIGELTNGYNVRLGESLVDKDGFPRGDVDVYMARKLVGEYYKIKGEWAALRKEVESMLEEKMRPKEE
jgi:Nas2 N_terminal domain